ncbi:MAG TPA: hypothetical protein DEB06_08245 [Phycisphaerales bacterium]|nr:hypothetical protein [Phycisphaerales bacterium]
MLSDTGGDTLVELLHTLEPALGALDRALGGALADGSGPTPESIAELRGASTRYAREFIGALPALRAGAERYGEPFKVCEAIVSVSRVSPGASAHAYARGLARLSAAPAAASEPRAASGGTLTVMDVRRSPFDPEGTGARGAP